MNLPEKVYVAEIGPRDGFQSVKDPISVEDKVKSINMATEAGYKIIEIGSFVHPKAVAQMATTDEVAKLINRKDGTEYRVLTTNQKGIERAVAAEVDKAKLTVSASETHNKNNFNTNREKAFEEFARCVDAAEGSSLKLSGAICMSFGCPYDGKTSIEKIEAIVKKFIELGIKEISLSDTSGMGNPLEVYEKSSYFIEKYPEVIWTLHLHNTRGLGLANAAAGLQAGITRFDSSFAGLGGCPFSPNSSGIISTEDLVNLLEEMKISTGVDFDKMIKLGKFIEELVGKKGDSYILKSK